MAWQEPLVLVLVLQVPQELGRALPLLALAQAAEPQAQALPLSVLAQAAALERRVPL
jgi:hypothetical protein